MSTVAEKYKLLQQAWEKEENWWKWKVWIDADQKDLSKIEAVEYTLHSTFSNPVRTVRERTTNFALEEEGWGGFILYARVVLKDKTAVPLEHKLTLQGTAEERGVHYTKGLSHHQVKTLPAPEQPKSKGIGRKVAIGAGLGAVILAVIFFLPFSNNQYSDNGTVGEDTTSVYPGGATPVIVHREGVDTAHGPGGIDTSFNRIPVKRPLIYPSKRFSGQNYAYRKAIDSLVRASPGYVAEEIEKRDRQIFLLQKELDSLKRIIGLKGNGQQKVKDVRPLASQQ